MSTLSVYGLDARIVPQSRALAHACGTVVERMYFPARAGPGQKIALEGTPPRLLDTMVSE